MLTFSSVPCGSAVTYVVSGGGGARLYAVGQSSWTARSVSAHHYVRAAELMGDALAGLSAADRERLVELLLAVKANLARRAGG